MKVPIVLLAVLVSALSAPQPRKLFHEHVNDFIDIILDEAGGDLRQLLDVYLEFEEFTATFDYMETADFKNLVYEMESLPAFKAVVDFLENDNIDIIYFIDLLNSVLEQSRPRPRHTASGQDFISYITDVIALLPKSELSALFDKKMIEDEEFRTAIENLQSDEWDSIWSALWENETFKVEAQILVDNGIDLVLQLDQLMAIFGQN